METATRTTSLALPPTLESASRARAAVRDLCESARVDRSVRDAAVLLADELVANALEHGGGSPTLEAVVAHGTLRLAVTDASPVLPQPAAADVALSDRGRGLLLVIALATRWGAEPREEGKTVWCEIDVDQASAAAVA